MTPDDTDVAKPRQIPCFACAEPVHPDARKCRTCGEWFEEIGMNSRRDVWSMRTAAEILADHERGDVPADGDDEIAPSLLKVDPFVLHVGAVPAPELIEALRGTRRSIAQRYGVIAPGIRVRVDETLSPDGYRFEVRGLSVADGTAASIEELAARASDVTRDHLATFLTREETAEMLSVARTDSPMVVQELVPNMLSLGQLRTVLHNLVSERVSIRDLSTILNALADHAVYTKDPHALTEHARSALGQRICADLTDTDGTLHLLHLHPDVERTIQNAIQLNEAGQVLMLDPATTASIVRHVEQALEDHAAPVALATPPKIRRHVVSLLHHAGIEVPVLGTAEIHPRITTEVMGTIEIGAGGSAEIIIDLNTAGPTPMTAGGWLDG